MCFNYIVSAKEERNHPSFTLAQKTGSSNQRNISLIYGQRKNFFELKSFVDSKKFYFM